MLAGEGYFANLLEDVTSLLGKVVSLLGEVLEVVSLLGKAIRLLGKGISLLGKVIRFLASDTVLIIGGSTEIVATAPMKLPKEGLEPLADQLLLGAAAELHQRGLLLFCFGATRRTGAYIGGGKNLHALGPA